MDVGTGAFKRTTGNEGNGDGKFNQPSSVAALGGNRMAVADTYNHRGVVLDAGTGAFLHTIGNRGSNDGHFDAPFDVLALGGGRLQGNHRAVVVSIA